jgi:hypothetical protein
VVGTAHTTKNQWGMGFHDLRLFNLAMLGKQGWRLMTRQESLCARVLKGRYYHDSYFLECSRRKKSSHTWRTVLVARDVLKAGLIWRLGDGSRIRIWEDRWIPNHFSGKPIVTQAIRTPSMCRNSSRQVDSGMRI